MNYEALIEQIAKLVGATGKAEEGKAVEGITGRGLVRGGTPHAPTDVERWIGPLSTPEKQVPLIHDYLRGHQALGEAAASGTSEVRGISVPVWQTTQKYLQSKIDSDPEVQAALRNLYAGMNTPKDPAVTSFVQKPASPEAEPQSVEVSPETTTQPQAKATTPGRALAALQEKQQSDAWNQFAIGLESQDPPRIDQALESIKALHKSPQLSLFGDAQPKEGWQKALDYMQGIEQQVQGMRAARVTNEDWTKALEDFRTQQGIDAVPMPKHVRRVVTRFEAWADAQKPPGAEGALAEILGVPKAVRASVDLSAPFRQGFMMISRPEFWQSFKPMFESWNESKFLQVQAEIRGNEFYDEGRKAGLALTDVHSRLAPQEEAFVRSKLAERLPFIGPHVKSSEQAYVAFLNSLRMNMFSNTMRAAKAIGVDTDAKWKEGLAEWINTGSGRGGNKDFNPGVLSTVLFSPRLGLSRLQALNPVYYAKLPPYVRQQAIKANLIAAGIVYSLVSMAGMAGAKISWDFRSPDGGKIRIGNTRIDLGAGHFQFIRLFTQLGTQQKVNPDTGKVTKLGEKFGADNGLDLVQNFIVSKEAPVASLVTDLLRGKQQSGQKLNMTKEVLQNLVPLSMQDVYDTFQDQGIRGLLYAAPVAFGVGVQTYPPNVKGTVPFMGVHGQVPPANAVEYVKAIEEADKKAATEAAEKSINKGPIAAEHILKQYVKLERMKVRIAWIKANQDSFVQAKRAGRKTVGLVAPEAAQ